MSRQARLALLCGAILAFPLVASDAHAEGDGLYTASDWPLETIRRPLTLAGSMLEIRGDTARINLSADDVPVPGAGFGAPISLAPDIYYGISDRLTVGLTHEVGVCVSGDDGGCSGTYDDFGLDAIYGLLRAGTLQAAVHGGLQFPRLSDPLIFGARGGLRARLTVSSVAVVIDPTVYIGFKERDLTGDFLEVPIEIQAQLNTQTMVYLASGVEGPFDGFGDGYRIPVGVGANFAVNERIDLGGEFRLENPAGKNHSFDERWLLLRAALRI